MGFLDVTIVSSRHLPSIPSLPQVWDLVSMITRGNGRILVEFEIVLWSDDRYNVVDGDICNEY